MLATPLRPVALTAPDRTRGATSGWAWGSSQLVALALVLGVAAFTLAPPADPDVFWHVRTGQWILQHHALPHVDHWSIGAAGHRWVAHSWLSEVLLAGCYKAWGFKGLSLFRSLTVTALVAALMIQAFRRTSPARALAVGTLALFATNGGWGERPQVFSFLLLVATAQLVRSAVAGRCSIWWVVPLTFLWANLHGLWFLAPALTGLALFGVTRARRREVVLAAVASVGVAALTPNGPVLLLQPLAVQGTARFISEWAAPSVHSVYGLAFFAMVLLLLVVWARTPQQVSPYALAQVLFAIGLGLLYIRTVAPAAVLLTPLLAEAWRPQTRGRAGFPVPVVAGSVVLLLTLGLAGAATVLIAEPSLPPHAPVAATAALLAATPPAPRIIDEYGSGGWLLLMAPTAHPAVDGRAEIYDPRFLADYLGALKLEGDWQGTLAALHADAALLHQDTPLAFGLRDHLHWRVAYQDRTWLVLVPPGGTSS